MFKLSFSPTEELITLLENNTIGSPGKGMLYKQMLVRQKIESIKEPYFLYIQKNDKIIGTCCFSKRKHENEEGGILTSFYIRYFSFVSAYRSAGTKRKSMKTGILRTEIKKILEGKYLLDNQNKFFHYAYVDPSNNRSSVLCNEFGFERVRTFNNFLFYRFFPKANEIQLTKIHALDIPLMKSMLLNLYSSYNMFNFENLFKSDNYYVVKQDGVIVAGVSANSDYWKIIEVPGFVGKAILRSSSKIKILNKLISKDYFFLAFEGIYFKEGYEKQLEKLFENLLEKYKVNSAMAFVDTDSSLNNFLKKLDCGFLEKISKKINANVICKFINMEDQDIEKFKKNPAYISSIDLT